MADHPIHQATKTSPYGHLTQEQFYQKHEITHHQSYMSNNRGMKIFTQTWQPSTIPIQELLGIVFMLHGYVSESGWLFELTTVAVAKLGFLTCSLDFRGHGRSDGRRGHMCNIDTLVDDTIQFVQKVRTDYELNNPKKLPCYFYGESLGGAVALLTCLRLNDTVIDKWAGLVLNGAMCGVSKKYKPPWPLEKLLPMAAYIAPSWRVSVTRQLYGMSYREAWKRELVRRCPRAHRSECAPAATAVEMLRVCDEVVKKCADVDVPMLIVHGEKDVVCDVESATLVHALAGSRDKSIKIVPGMWHQLIGETRENVELGFGYIFSWLVDRAKKANADNL